MSNANENNWREITDVEYRKFIENHSYVIIENTKIEIGKPKKVKLLQPKDFKLETTTVWSFPKRGDWATHYLNAKYRGNWAPQVARNLILRYSNEGDIVLDAFVGSGTTLIETKLTNRRGIGVDINEDAIMLTRDRLRFSSLNDNFLEQKTYVGDARHMNFLKDNSIDLIATHPPYVNIIPYTKNSNKNVDGDLSKIHSLDEFCGEMGKVAKEFYRVLKPNRYCAILIGDTRRHKHVVPVSFRIMQVFLNNGFVLKEDIIKVQHNTKMASVWSKKSVQSNFLLLMHEHLFVFRKPESGEDLKDLSESYKI
jgi:DNA modification methylase